MRINTCIIAHTCLCVAATVGLAKHALSMALQAHVRLQTAVNADAASTDKVNLTYNMNM